MRFHKPDFQITPLLGELARGLGFGFLSRRQFLGGLRGVERSPDLLLQGVERSSLSPTFSAPCRAERWTTPPSKTWKMLSTAQALHAALTAIKGAG
ncbi:hypothetical protein [Brevundimonas albigilva]|uniref:Uncharacterized protein n=1 Tax=Brevundimonas albigilva TaxID=1312364 RepID=A0ABY4STC7_9CAUL|nr:hypothetical protein [Brevundimonas albigilva]URI15925.1 hypothetical protein M8231_02735 [Brevundimonas albigilva]